MKKVNKGVKAKALDKKFDEGKDDVLEHFDVENAIKKVNVDFPLWMVKALDEEARKLAIPRQAVIKSWIKDRIQSEKILQRGDDRRKGAS